MAGSFKSGLVNHADVTVLLQALDWSQRPEQRITLAKQKEEASMLRSMIISLALLASPASAYLAQNSYIVRDLGNGQYEVQVKGGLSAPAAWCAIGDYAIRALNLGPATPIWRVSEPPRRQGQSITFALTGEGAASKTGLFVLNETDASLSAGFAQEFCWNPKTVD
jgi:hypothetical protein